jgi:VWFA-related protein
VYASKIVSVRPIAAVLLLASAVTGQEPGPPSFPSQASAITVDVVVVDREGRPVRDLTAADFTVLEDGKPQVIVGFESHAMPLGVRAAATPTTGPRLAAPAPGRHLALLIDDFGIRPAIFQEVRPALARWIRERAAPDDEITLLTSSGDVWWTDRVAEGREDLLAVLDRVTAKKWPTSAAERTAEVGTYGGMPADRGDDASRIGSGGSSRTVGGPAIVGAQAARDPSAVRDGAAAVQSRAVMRAIERLAEQGQGMPGRKSIQVVSEAFARDPDFERRLQDVLAGAQRSNTAVYFTRALGIPQVPLYDGDSSGAAASASSVARLKALATGFAVAGATQLAEATGGTLSASNDLAAGLEAMATDAGAYYLLGYQPAGAPDGKWHALEVKVARPDVTVRTRRRYRATRPEPAQAANPAKEEKDATPLALRAGARDGIPLQMAAYVRGPDGAGLARVLVALQIGGDRVAVRKDGDVATASLELSIVAVSRDRPLVTPLTQRLEVTLPPGRAGGWWALYREVHVTPGVTQVRAFVRDTVGGRDGAASRRIAVPDVSAPYLSTTLLSDPAETPVMLGGQPPIAASATRAFAARGELSCEYEVFGFGGRSLPGVARLRGGYTLRGPGGEPRAVVAPTPIEMDGGRAVRRLAIPLEGLAPGGYELTFDVTDDLAQRSFSARETFTVEPADTGSGR